MSRWLLIPLLAFLTWCLPTAPSALAHPGDLDHSFGDDGRRVISLPPGFEPTGVDLHPDGAIVAWGRIGSGEASRAALLRIGTDGSVLDPSTPGGEGAPRISSDSLGASTWDENLVEASDGGMLRAGTRTDAQYDRVSSITRLGPELVPDPAFGQAGTATVDFRQDLDSFSNLAIQPDGRIVAVGWGASGYSGRIGHVARFLPNGELDASFMEGGQAVPHEIDSPHLITGPDGRIILLANEQGCLRLGTNCNYPKVIYGLSFGTGPVPPDPGKVVFNPGRDYRARVNDGVVLPDGRVLVVGTRHRAGTKALKPMTAIVDPALNLERWQLLPSQRIVGGRFWGGQIAGLDPQLRPLLTAQPSSRFAALSRLTASGIGLDKSFGVNGSVQIPTSSWGFAATVALDGSTLVLTHDRQRTPAAFVVSRYVGGDDREPPAIAIHPLRSRCTGGSRVVKVSVRDESALARVTVRREGRVVTTTTRPRLSLRVPAHGRRASARTIGVAARDAAGNLAEARRVVPRCR